MWKYFFIIVLCNRVSSQDFKVPPAKLEAIYPKGLRATVQDDGFSFFSFRWQLDKETGSNSAAQRSEDVSRGPNGEWIFKDREARVKVGDRIQFWTYVMKDGYGYRQGYGEWTVDGFVNEAGNRIDRYKPAAVPLSAGGLLGSGGLLSGSLLSSGGLLNAGSLLAPATQAPAPRPTNGNRRPTTQTSSDRNDVPCEVSQTKVSVPGTVCRGQLVFEDNFNSGLDKGKVWTPEIRFPAEPDYPFNFYLNDRNLQVQDGHLRIKPITTESKYGDDFVRQSLDLSSRCTGVVGTETCYREASGPQILPPIITAKVTTKNKFSFKFGRVEIRAKMPAGDWLLPEILLEPRDGVYGLRNYASGMIHIACTKGNVAYSKNLYGGPIMFDVDPYRSNYLKKKVGYDHWNKDFHNYTLTWRPDGISLFVDGEQYGSVTPGEGFYQDAIKHNVSSAQQWLKGSVMAPFDEMFYISLGLRVGGVNDFPDTPDKPWKNRATKAMLNFWNAREDWLSTWYEDTSALLVDSVRVYAL